MKTKVDFYLYKKESKESVGTPLISDTLTFPQDIIDELLNNPAFKKKEEDIHKAKSDIGVQTGNVTVSV